jgi:ABC-type enterobactin transport system permease subunit
MSVQGTSLGEARELYTLLQECMSLLDQVERKSVRVERQSVTKLLVALNAVTMVLRRMDLGEEYNKIIDKVTKITQLLMILRMSLMATQAAAGPIGWISLGAGAVGSILTAEDLVATLFSG